MTRRLNGTKRHKGPDVPIQRTAPRKYGGRKPGNLTPPTAKPSAGPRLVASDGQLVARGLTKGDAARLRDQQRAEEAVTRAEAILASPEPTTAEAKGIALRVLKEVALRGGEPPMVAASKVLLDYATKVAGGAAEDALPPDPGAAFADEGAAQTRQ